MKIAIKLERDKFIVKMDSERSFAEQKDEVRECLSKMGLFLKNADMKAAYDGAVLSFEEEMELADMLEGFFGHEVDFSYRQRPPEKLMKRLRANGEELVLKVERTVRGGEKIVSNGNIVVVGDVNPAAEVRAAGDIYIFGALRGRAVSEKENGRVFALAMQPEQIVINGAAAYNSDMSRLGGVSLAYMSGGKIYIKNL